MAAAHPISYAASSPAAAYSRQPIASAQPAQQAGYTAATTHVQREQDVFVLPDHVNESIPEDIRFQYPQDDQGRVLFFTKPPVDTRSILSGRLEGEGRKPLAHSAKFQEYKAALQRKIKEKEENEREMAKDEETEKDKDQDINMADAPATEPLTSNAQSGSMPLSSTEQSGPDPTQAMLSWAEQMAEASKAEYVRMYGDDWKQYYDNDELRHRERKILWDQEQAKKQAEAEQKRQLPEEDESPYATSYSFKGRNPWVGRYEDDFDPRYGF